MRAYARLNPDDELSELIPLDQAAEIAGVSSRTLRRWITDRRLRVLAGHVVERELLAVEKERWESRHAGRPGARPYLTSCVLRISQVSEPESSRHSCCS
jgi:hypothetical protein